MQRNLRSEIMIAVGAVLIIGFGLLFAVLLTSSPENANGTAVVSVSSPTVPAEASEALETEVVTEEASTEPGATEEPAMTEAPSDEPTATDEPSATEEPTATDESTATNEPTATEEASATDKPSPTEASTATDEADATTEASDEPTTTEAGAATEEASPTRRNIGRATRVPTATNEPEPSATNTRRPSATPPNEPSPTRTLRLSATPSPTVTPRPSPTPTSQNAVTGIIPTPPPSPTVLPLNQPSRTPSSCQLPAGWTSYTVQAGNTLFAIALATNSTVDELRAANCIENVDNIQAGDVVFVPRAPLTPVATFVNTGSRAGLRPIGCQNTNVQITSPISAQRINGTFTVYGSASRSDFLYYKLEVRPDAASIYNFYMDSRTQVSNAVLGEINSELFGTGVHWIKLTVVDLSASIPADATCEIPVIFE